MASRSGRYVITFNGEIYNFRRLRSQLVGLGHTFLSSSDTEVILAAIELEFAILNALGAQKKMKEGEQIVPKSYCKSNISKELSQICSSPLLMRG